MKKLVWLLVLALLVVPAFAAITVTIPASGTLSFESQLYPTPATFNAVASLSFSFSLSGDTKTGANVTATINGVSDLTQGGITDTSGTITFSKVAGLLDLSLHKGTLTVGGTRIVGTPIDKKDGVKVVVPVAPVTVTAGYQPDPNDALTYTQGVLAVRVDGSVSPVSFYGLFVSDQGTPKFAFGGSVKPVSMVEAFGEYANVSYTYIVGATVTPVSGVSLYGEYKGDNTYKVSATVNTIPGVSLYGEYTGNYKVSATVTTIPNVKVYGEFDSSLTDNELFGYVAATQSVPVGSLELGAGYKKLDSVFGGYARLKTPLGPATNTLVASYNFSVSELDTNGWSRNVLVKSGTFSGFMLVNKISVSF